MMGKGRTIYGLVSTMAIASRIVKAAGAHHLAVRNFDKAAPLLEHAAQERPAFVILDWDGCEAEAFKLLDAFQKNEVLKGVPVVGCVSQSKASLKEEAEGAGCIRVYLKTEFFRILNDLFLRYVQ